MLEESPASTGWAALAEYDEVTTLIDTLLGLDPDETYTRAELADESGITLKTLHLRDVVAFAVDIDLLEPVDANGEAVRYSVNTDSEVFELAGAFGEAVSESRNS
jgi:hypothetical protein